MSISTLAQVAHLDARRAGAKSVSISAAATTTVANRDGAMEPPPADPGAAIRDALAAVAAYVPTEIIGVYTFWLSLTATGSTSTPLPLSGTIGFAVASPILVWLLFAERERSSGAGMPWSPAKWPLWAMFSSALAFLAWAAAIPGSVWSTDAIFSSTARSVALLVISGLLPLIGKLVRPAPKA